MSDFDTHFLELCAMLTVASWVLWILAVALNSWILFAVGAALALQSGFWLHLIIDNARR